MNCERNLSLEFDSTTNQTMDPPQSLTCWHLAIRSSLRARPLDCPKVTLALRSWRLRLEAIDRNKLFSIQTHLLFLVSIVVVELRIEIGHLVDLEQRDDPTAQPTSRYVLELDRRFEPWLASI